MTNNPRPRQPAAGQETVGYLVSHGPGWNPHATNPTSTGSALWRHIHHAHHSGEQTA